MSKSNRQSPCVSLLCINSYLNMLIFNLMYGSFLFSWFVSNLIRFKLLILKIMEKILKFKS